MFHHAYTGRRFWRWPLLLALTLLVAATGVSVLLFVNYQRALNNNPAHEQQQILARIGSVVALPNESPTSSTVIDTSKLANATLRARAQNGDRLLIFAKAKRLIIYRPSTGKVIDMLTIQGKKP